MEDVVAGTPLLEAHTADGELRLTAAAAWTAPHAAELERRVEEFALNPPADGGATIDMQGVERFDTYGALLLVKLARLLKARGQPLRVTALADRYQGLLHELQRIEPAAGEASRGGNGIRLVMC